MVKKKHIIIIICLIISLLAAGTGGYFIGKHTETVHYQSEQDLEIRLNRSDLDGLGEIEGTIYVTGHKSPDSDTVCGSIAYAALLRKLGYDAVPVVLGDINQESAYILQTAGLDVPERLEDASGLNMVLVDHSDYSQSADGAENSRILSVIDHHGIGTITTDHQLIYDSRPLGAAATVIWIRYRNYGVELDKQTAHILLGAVLSDTKNLKADTTTFADKEAVKTLSDIAGITDVDAFYLNMYKASISYTGMTDEEIFFSDYKEYERGLTKYSIGCINVYDEADALNMAERMKAILPSTLPTTGMDMAFAQINIFHDDISITYIVPSDDTADEVIRTAFPDKGEFDGTSYKFDPGMSRKQVIVPAITDVLDSYPKE
ncbi:MAG: DHH family phosphoesterase [Oribacterium sp.]|nr:DHH family phosphoesterase [Oribacterium sp.]